MSRIALWFDGGGSYGYGNIRRSRELGEMLVRRGHSVHFEPQSELSERLFSGRDSGWVGENPEVVVLDLPYVGDEAVRRARKLGARVLALDFDGSVAPDVVISLQAIRRVPVESRVLVGVKYAIIREEFRLGEEVRCSEDEVLVVVGGGDQDGLTQRIVERLPDVRVCVVQGPAGGTLDLERPGLRVEVDPPNLAQMMAGCAWAVTTGGTTMLEMLSMGKAIHVVPRSLAEEIFTRKFEESGALLGVGLDRLEAPRLEDIERCGSRGRELVDGQGCKRICVEIENLL